MQTLASTAERLVFPIQPSFFSFFFLLFPQAKVLIITSLAKWKCEPRKQDGAKISFSRSPSYFDGLARRAAGGRHRRLVGVQCALDSNCLFSRRNQPNAEIMSGNESHWPQRLRRLARYVFIKWGAA